MQDRTRVHDMAEVINHRHRMAQLVSRASSELFTLLFFQDKNIEEDAMIVAVKANGIRIMVPRFGIESGITLWQEAQFDEEQSSAVDKATAIGTKNPWKLDDSAMTLTGPAGLKYTIFEQVRVRIYVQESKMRRKWLQVDLIDKVATSTPQAAIAKHIQSVSQTEEATKTETETETTAATTAKKAGKKREIASIVDDEEAEPAGPTKSGKKSTKTKAATTAAPVATPGKTQAKKKQKL